MPIFPNQQDQIFWLGRMGTEGATFTILPHMVNTAKQQLSRDSGERSPSLLLGVRNMNLGSAVANHVLYHGLGEGWFIVGRGDTMCSEREGCEKQSCSPENLHNSKKTYLNSVKFISEETTY